MNQDLIKICNITSCKTYFRCAVLVCFIFVDSLISAQQDSVWFEKPALTISGFIDVFYVYDFNRPQGNFRQPFLFNHNRHNEFNLNLGLIDFELASTKYRFNLALQTGVYANDNYVAEPGLLKNIYEANIGLALDNKNKLWLDVGILPSHIGFESAISIDNPTLTRSLLAENSPYFLTGAKLSYKPSDQWELAGLLVNGWQRIQRVRGNSLLSLGTQIVYRPSRRIAVNWSTFVGTDDPDVTRRMRYFNNLFSQVQINENLDLIAGLDIGVQQVSKGNNAFESWLSPILIAQITMNQNWQSALRVEYFKDHNEVIVPIRGNGFEALGISLNLDYVPIETIKCRIEGRWLSSPANIFETRNINTNNNFVIGVSISIRFAEEL